MTDPEISIDELSSRLGEVPVVDVRHDYEYDGAFGSPCCPRQGHIPGAKLLDVNELYVLTEEQVKERLGLPDGAEVVVYCHSGSRSATASLILRRYGYQARNYGGSWHEWSRTELPLETE
jgi:thiosulfate/3-mercaptopyruvate sulfurtransferase